MEQDLLDMLRQIQNELGSLKETTAAFDKKVDQKITALKDDMIEAMEALDEKMDQKITALKVDMNETTAALDKKIDDKADELLTGVKFLLENVVESEIKLVAESVRSPREAQVSPERVGTLESDVDVLKTVVRTHSHEINALKKAQ